MFSLPHKVLFGDTASGMGHSIECAQPLDCDKYSYTGCVIEGDTGHAQQPSHKTVCLPAECLILVSQQREIACGRQNFTAYTGTLDLSIVS